MEVHPLLHQLDSLLAAEPAKRPAAGAGGGISPGMRDGSAHVLRCLKVWYDLPSDVFHTALANIDTFLAKMKAQPKHLSCIAVSSFHLACSQVLASASPRSPQPPLVIPEPSDLVTISQSRCSASDLLRMEAILANKLDNKQQQGVPPVPVTPLSLLRQMMAVSRAAAARLEISPAPPASPPPHLLHQLEILVCDSSTLKFRPCEVALALLCTEFQRQCGDHPDTTPALMGFVSELQKYCNISASEFCTVLGAWVVLDPKINPEQMEMFADVEGRGGILEPPAAAEIVFKQDKHVEEMMYRCDDQLRDLKAKSAKGEDVSKDIAAREKLLLPLYKQVSVLYCDLHDRSGRMKGLGVIHEELDWPDSRQYLHWRIRRRMLENNTVQKLRKEMPERSREEAVAVVADLTQAVVTAAAGEAEDRAVAEWLEGHPSEVEARIERERQSATEEQIYRLIASLPAQRRGEVVRDLVGYTRVMGRT